MSRITWAEGIPSNASVVGLFPNATRSVWSSIAVGMATEHVWPGSGGGSDTSAGDLLPGGSRTFAEAQSASSLPSQGVGRLFYAFDTARLLAYDSSGTYLVGTRSFSEHLGASSGGPWVRFTGSYTTTATSGSTTITFPAPFAAIPNAVHQSINTTQWVVASARVTSSAFSSLFSALAGSIVGGFTVTWEALGQLSSASF